MSGAEPSKSKPTIAVDFDGVIHLYREGWKDGSIYDSYVPGFFKWVMKVKDQFKIVIVSSRLSDPTGQQEMNMRTWIVHQFYEAVNRGEVSHDDYPEILTTLGHFSKEKPPAFITIDDRALTFSGDWLSPSYSSEFLFAFKPWNTPE